MLQKHGCKQHLPYQHNTYTQHVEPLTEIWRKWSIWSLE